MFVAYWFPCKQNPSTKETACARCVLLLCLSFLPSLSPLNRTVSNITSNFTIYYNKILDHSIYTLKITQTNKTTFFFQIRYIVFVCVSAHACVCVCLVYSFALCTVWWQLSVWPWQSYCTMKLSLPRDSSSTII